MQRLPTSSDLLLTSQVLQTLFCSLNKQLWLLDAARWIYHKLYQLNTQVVIRPDEDICINHSTIKIFRYSPCSLQVYQEHVSSLFCSLLIYLFLMEATLVLAVLGILIPRDLAALNCFFFEQVVSLMVLDKLKELLLFSTFS